MVMALELHTGKIKSSINSRRRVTAVSQTYVFYACAQSHFILSHCRGFNSSKTSPHPTETINNKHSPDPNAAVSAYRGTLMITFHIVIPRFGSFLTAQISQIRDLNLNCIYLWVWCLHVTFTSHGRIRKAWENIPEACDAIYHLQFIINRIIN